MGATYSLRALLHALVSLGTLVVTYLLGRIVFTALRGLPWPAWLRVRPQEFFSEADGLVMLSVACGVGLLAGVGWRTKIHRSVLAFWRSFSGRLALHHVWAPVVLGLASSFLAAAPIWFLSVTGACAADLPTVFCLTGFAGGFLAGFYKQERRPAKSRWTAHPISSYTEDRYGHTIYVERLLGSLGHLSSPESHAIGLFGVWGTGKTSVLRMFESRLRELQHETRDLEWGEPYVVARFTPWAYPSHQAMQQGLLDEIEAVLSRYTFSIGPERGFQRLSAALATAKPLKWIGAFQSTYGLSEAKEDVSRLLEALPYRLLVLIDEADRLSGESLAHLLRLIEPVAGFREVTFIVALDPNCLTSLLSSVYSWLGPGALGNRAKGGAPRNSGALARVEAPEATAEARQKGGGHSDHLGRVVTKFFDDSIRIAPPPPHLIRESLSEILQDTVEGAGQEQDMTRRAMLISQLSRVLVIPRAIASLGRRAQATRKAAPNADGVDVVAVSALRVIWPQFDGFVMRFARSLIDAEWPGRLDSADALLEALTWGSAEDYDELLADVPGDCRDVFRDLFPRTTGTVRMDTLAAAGLGRIHHPAYFDYFFWGTPVPPELMRDYWKEVRKALGDESSSPVEAASRIAEMLKSHEGRGVTEGQLIDQVLARGFEAHVRDLGDGAVEKYLTALSIAAREWDGGGSLSGPGVSQRWHAAMLILRVCSRLGVRCPGAAGAQVGAKVGYEILSAIIEEPEASDFVAAMIVFYALGVSEREEACVSDRSHRTALARSYRERVREKTAAPRAGQPLKSLFSESDAPVATLVGWASAEQHLDHDDDWLHESCEVSTYLQQLFEDRVDLVGRLVASIITEPRGTLQKFASLKRWEDWLDSYQASRDYDLLEETAQQRVAGQRTLIREWREAEDGTDGAN